MGKTEIQAARLLDVPAAGRYLSISAWTVRDLVWRGDLPAVRIGRLVRLDRADLDRFLEGRKRRASDN